MRTLLSLLILFFISNICIAQLQHSIFDSWHGISEDVSLAEEVERKREQKILRATQLIKETSLEYYPNPADNSLMVKPKFEGPYDLKIRTSEGFRIWANDNLRGVAEIDLDKLTPGIYLLDYRSQAKRIVELLVKK
ncbi:MAG: T9SS type A sorting domain-containing protein [Saprospiraceae bacterium]|nr:T9SS type A sorting domain-containing protein [Saprospiraceae bacterium]